MRRRFAPLAATACFLATALVGGVAISQAQDVKTQWLIGTPPPPGSDTTASAPAAAPAPTPANDKKADQAAPDHGLPVVKNPYSPNDAAIVKEGQALFISMACSGCHGAGGGGGMCPPVINSTWVYGNDDTTLFNLIRLGSVELRSKGYTRIGRERVVGDMPAYASMSTEDQVWKLITYIRSKYAGD